jgi:hypothetical protein
MIGIPCDSEGYDLPPNAPPPPTEPADTNDYFPFKNEEEFQLANFLFSRVQMSAGNTTVLMDLWAAIQQADNIEANPPFKNAKDLYDTIDSIPLGDTPWEGFKVKYDGEIPQHAPSWMKKEYEVWYRNPLEVMEAQIGNPDFANEMDYAPKEVCGRNKKRQYTDLMSGQWAWDQAVCQSAYIFLIVGLIYIQTEIAHQDPETHGAMFAPVVLGSDKTTVSVATGQNEFYPLYASLGNVQHHVRRAHRNAVTVIGFLAIPKSMFHFFEMNLAPDNVFSRKTSRYC